MVIHIQEQSSSTIHHKFHLAVEEDTLFELDQYSYEKLITHLEAMNPFEAIRLAKEINKENGFEVVSFVAIAGFKARLKNQNGNIRNEKSKIKIVNKGNCYSQRDCNTSRKLHKSLMSLEEKQNKKIKMQKGYMRLLNLQK